MNPKPNIAISMGDPAGISPEIVVLCLESAVQICRPTVFGHLPTLEQIVHSYKPDVTIDVLEKPMPPKEEGHVGFFRCGDSGDPITAPGQRCAAVQLEALEKAVTAVLGEHFSAIVTAPVSKTQIATVLPSFTGHTEYLARRAGMAPDGITMVFAAKHLVVGLVSTHIALRDAADAVTSARLSRTFEHLLAMLFAMHPGSRPRIGVAALNPHAGEGGLFGSEEQDLIAPFCDGLDRRQRAELVGPLSADAIYRDAIGGKFDGVIAAYHDQAMIPLKLAGLGQMVNVTMGIPFIRTSPDHGVAYDIARTGRADPSGFRLALELAVELLTPACSTKLS